VNAGCCADTVALDDTGDGLDGAAVGWNDAAYCPLVGCWGRGVVAGGGVVGGLLLVQLQLQWAGQLPPLLPAQQGNLIFVFVFGFSISYSLQLMGKIIVRLK
jgi:hypothetical protein